jgi:hypothetical protein
LTCTLDGTLSNYAIQTQARYDATVPSWVIGYYGRSYLNRLGIGGGSTARLEPTSNAIAAFDIRYIAADMYIYYCSTSGRLYKRNATTNVETELLLPSSTITCSGQSLFYNSSRDSVIFIYKQNDMYGIAEYQNP